MPSLRVNSVKWCQRIQTSYLYFDSVFSKKYHDLFFKYNSFIEILSYLSRQNKLKAFNHSGIHITINTIAELEYANNNIKKIFLNLKEK